MTDDTIPAGSVVQYRKVGRCQVVRYVGGGWYEVEWLTGPYAPGRKNESKYRRVCLRASNVISTPDAA